MTGPCPRPECGGDTHTDGWGNPIRCPREDISSAASAVLDNWPEHNRRDEHDRVVSEVTQAVYAILYTDHEGAGPEEASPVTPLEQTQATIESLRYQIRRAREALGTDEADSAEAAITRVRALHHDEYGSCAHCTRADSVPWPCPTIRALDGQEARHED